MPRKALSISVELDIQAVFPSAGCLSEVQSLLSLHDVNAVLIQEADGESAVQLARFTCSLLHLLFPSPCSKGLLAGVDVDLLMEASADFPGILAPKIELSSRTVVEEVTNFSMSPEDHSDAYVINPKTVVSRARCTGAIHDSSAFDHSLGDLKDSHSKKTRNRRMINFDGSPSRQRLRRRATSLPRRSQTTPEEDCDAYLSADSVEDPCSTACPCIAGHKDTRCFLCTRYKTIFRDSDMSDDFYRADQTVKSRRCRCPDRDKCAFMRCRRSPRRHIRHEAHRVRDSHWESSPAAAALRRSQVLSPHSETPCGLPEAADIQDGAAPSAHDSLVGGCVPQSPAAALHARVERLLQSEADPENIHKWSDVGRSKKSPRRVAALRYASLTSSDDSIISQRSPPPSHHSPSRSYPRIDPKYDTRKTIKFDETPHYVNEIGKNSPLRTSKLTSVYGRVMRAFPCSCSNAYGSHHSIQNEKQKSLPDMVSLRSCDDERAGDGLANDNLEVESAPREFSEQGSRRIAFYSNLERYYHKLYTRARQRAAARINTA